MLVCVARLNSHGYTSVWFWFWFSLKSWVSSTLPSTLDAFDTHDMLFRSVRTHCCSPDELALARHLLNFSMYAWRTEWVGGSLKYDSFHLPVGHVMGWWTNRDNTIRFLGVQSPMFMGQFFSHANMECFWGKMRRKQRCAWFSLISRLLFFLVSRGKCMMRSGSWNRCLVQGYHDNFPLWVCYKLAETFV